MTIYPTKNDMLKKRAMYQKAIDGLAEPLVNKLLEAYKLYEYSLDEQKKIAITEVKEDFKYKKEKAHEEALGLFDEAWTYSLLEGDCAIKTEFVHRLIAVLSKKIEEEG